MGTLHSDFMVKGTWKNENSAIVRSRRESSKKGIFYIILWRADFAEFIAYKIELAWNYCWSRSVFFLVKGIKYNTEKGEYL